MENLTELDQFLTGLQLLKVYGGAYQLFTSLGEVVIDCRSVILRPETQQLLISLGFFLQGEDDKRWYWKV